MQRVIPYFFLKLKVNPAKEASYSKLYRNYNPRGIKRIFDKETKGNLISSFTNIIKGFILNVNDAMSSKMQFPKSNREELGLV